MASLNGKWKPTKLENFDAFIEAIGVNEQNKQNGLKLFTPENNIIQEISVDGNHFCIKMITPVSTQKQKGFFGQEFKETGLDGKAIKAKFTLDGDKLVENLSGPFTTSNTRYIKDEDLVMEQTSGSVTSISTYTKF